MDAFIKRMSPDAPARSVELIRRTRRGGYQIQIFEAYFSQIRAALRPLTVTLTDFGSWTMTPMQDEPRSRGSQYRSRSQGSLSP